MGTDSAGSESEPDRTRAIVAAQAGGHDGALSGSSEAMTSVPTADDDNDTPPIAVSFHHGSFDRSDHPVLLGHYLATPITGAEGFTDRQFGGRLSERMARNQYPNSIGESLFVSAPRRRHPAAGVLIVGLGEYGELTELQFIETIRSALVRHALDEADEHDGPEPLELGIGTVLVGSTGDHGLRVSGSVRGVVNGIREANRDLHSGAHPVRAYFTKLQVWEWDASEAELAFRTLIVPTSTLSSNSDRHRANDVLADPTLREAGGALMASAPTETLEPIWWHVSVRGSVPTDDDGVEQEAYLLLDFAVGGRLARTGAITHRVERRMLERLLRRAVGTSQPDPGLHTTLFEVLFPKQLKWDLMAAQHIQLEVDDATADIPWEMLSARNPNKGSRGQLALRAPLVRQLRLPDMPLVRRATTPRALVIGNPPVGPSAASLPGAYREAQAVREVLAADSNYGEYVEALCFDVDAEPSDATTISIETALFKNDYRIVHIAAHGMLNPDDASRTGVAIGPDDFITATKFRQLNVTPDLVFLNCCHLANVGIDTSSDDHTRTHFNELGASLARQLIDSGVRAVVVAGWAVDDAAAESFARMFYELMLRGETFGQAVYEARLAARAASPGHSTWGAYQCYGDRGYTLPTSMSTQTAHARVAPATIREARRRIEMLVGSIESTGVASAVTSSGSGPEGELLLLAETAENHGWTKKGAGRFCEEMGRAWAALGRYEEAIEWYERGLSASDGAMSLGGVEQLVNLKDRYATTLVRRADATDEDRAKAQDLSRQAMESIVLLEKLSKSGERIALRAGHLKRRATSVIDGRQEALADAAKAYREAYEQEPADYTLLNYVALEEIRRRMAGDPSQASDLYSELDRAVERSRAASTSDYWVSVGRADGTLTAAIRDDALAQQSDEIIELFTDAFDNRSTAGQRQSTLDHLLDLADLHPDAAASRVLRNIHAQLVTQDT